MSTSTHLVWNKVGLIYAILLVIFTAFYTLFMRVTTQLYAIDVSIFTALSLIVSAFIMMLFAGPGRLGRETLRSPATWLYATLLIATYILDFVLILYVSATEASLIYNIAVITSLIGAAVWLQRKPRQADYICAIFVLAGLVIVFSIQPVSIFWTVLLLGLGADLVDTARLFIAETHRESVLAHAQGNIRDKARVMSFVTFVSSTLFLLGLLGLSLLKSLGVELLGLMHFVPELEAFRSAPTIFAAIIFGVSILVLIRYFMWSAVFHLKTESVALLLTFLPLVMFLIEWPLSQLIPAMEFDNPFTGQHGQAILLATLLMTCGAGIAAYAKIKQM